MRVDWRRYDALDVAIDARGLLTVVLRNPGKRNAVSAAMDAELQQVFTDAWIDPAVIAVLLTGDGDAFCTGTDLDALPGDDDGTLRGLGGGTKRIFFSMLDCEKPIIAKVRGPAYGLGANLALACDIVVAAENARFCDPHVRLGIAPGDGGAALWPLLIGFARAKDLILTGARLDARRAADIGLIARCVADAELDAEVESVLAGVLGLPPLGLAYAKASMNAMLRQMLGGAFEAALAYDLLTLRTEGHRAAVASVS